MFHWHEVEHFSEVHSATLYHDVDDVRPLLSSGLIPIDGIRNHIDPAIIMCIRSCRGKEDEPKILESLKLLVQHGADVNVRSCHHRSFGMTAAMIAAGKGLDSCLRFLVESGTDLTLRADSGDNTLMIAARSGRVDSVKYLIEDGKMSSLNQVNNQGETALMVAASGPNDAHALCVKFLVEAGADLYVQDEFGNTALMLAAKAGGFNSVKYLTGRMSVSSLIQINNTGQTTLMMAASGSDAANALCVKYLVEAGADLDVLDKFGSTALMNAAEAGVFNSVKYLTERMSVPSRNQARYDGTTALTIAASNNSSEHTSCLKCLVEAGADVNVQNEPGYTALMLASVAGSVESVKLLTERMSVSTLDKVNGEGQTALMLAAVRSDDNDAVILKHLLEAGADVNVQCKGGYTALMYATEFGKVKCVKFLTERMSVSTLDKVNDHGQTALMLARARYGTDTVEILKYLVEAGADVNIQCKHGYTALMEAASRYGRDTVEILKYLVEAGADVNIQCKHGYTALMKAVSRYDVEISHLQYLITVGADLNVADTETGFTALMIALDRGNDSAVSLLLGKGALVNIVTPDLKTPLSLHPGLNNLMITKLLSHGLDPALSYRNQGILHVIVAKREKSVVRGLVMNGFPPVDVKFDYLTLKYNKYLPDQSKTPMSPLALALDLGNHEIARYLIVNRFFTRYDLVQLCRDQKLRQSLQREPECLEILDFLSARPHSLHDLCLVTISSALSQYLVHDPQDIPPGDSRWMCKPTFRERVDLLQLPPALKRELLHQTPFASISCESWGDISLE